MQTWKLKLPLLRYSLLSIPLSFLLGLAMPAHADSPLADTIKSGDRQSALAMIRAGADVNEPQNDGTTPLHWAVYQVDPELVATLLRSEAGANVSNAFGASPLSQAARVANPDMVAMLLDAGADPDMANSDGQTPLMLAAWTGVVEVAELLINHGANVNAEEIWTGQSALMWAASRNHPDMAELLIASGADVRVRARTFDWERQITSEPRNQYRPAGGLTPLLYATRSGCLRCVQAIIEAGADVDMPTPEGVTPLIVAIDTFNFQTAHFLLDAGANPHTFDWWGRTPLYTAIDVRTIESRGQRIGSEEQEAALELARRLLDRGVYVDPVLNFGRPGRGGGNGRFADEHLSTGTTPLLRAAVSHDFDAVSLLLGYDAAVDLPNIFGATPLIVASGLATPRGMLSDGSVYSAPDVEDRAINTLQRLLDAGADINTRVTDTTSYTAFIPRHNAMTDRQGQTAIYGPGKWGWMNVAKFLVENGAKVNVTDFYGKTPADSALAKAGGEQEEVWEELANYLSNAN
jgi:ankyrin repeat protein